MRNVTVVSPQLAVAGIKPVADTFALSVARWWIIVTLLALLCSFTRARAQGSETEFNSGKRERAKKEAHVPLNLDGLVRAPARSISLVPANDVKSSNRPHDVSETPNTTVAELNSVAVFSGASLVDLLPESAEG